jgi:methylglutaconyl-CoA hydratase
MPAGAGGGGAVRVRVDGAVCHVELHRPEVRNALNEEVRAGLAAVAAEVADNPAVRVVALRGAGPAFSAGADLRERPAPAPTWEARRRRAGAWQRVLDAWEALPQVTVAGVHGYAVGGACLLAAACDLRVAEEGAWFQIPELAIGIPLTWAGLPRLAREIGLSRVRDLVLTGRRVPASEAHAWGLVQRLAPAGGLDETFEAVVAELLAAPAAPVAMTKEALTALGRGGPAAAAWADADLLAWSLREG